MRTSFARTVTAVLTLLVMLVQGTWVLAGTTGGLSGTVTDASSGHAIAGAKVSVSSPSQSATVTSDQNGRYGFVSLAPDTYTITVVVPGYQPFSQPGVTVIADQTSSYNFAPNKTIQEIGRTRSRSATDLVKSGQTADVYSISGQLSQNVQAFGGGASLFQTFAALATVPGVYVPNGTNFGQNNAAPYIRGGRYDQVGFEYDGIPVNRAFDNYVSNTQGITGQQELQVYTGGVPAASAGEGLSGYINQIIRAGTYPATASVEGVLGAPSFYHYLRGEYGAASRDRSFSYYVGATGWNQSYRYGDQFNGGTGYPGFSQVLGTDGAGGSIALPFAVGGVADNHTRETVANVHIGIPHRNGDGGRDDIQFLGSVGRQITYAYDSINDYGGVNGPFWGGVNPPLSTGRVYVGPIFSGVDPTLFRDYAYPNLSPGSYGPNGQIFVPPDFRGSQNNNNGIFKAQYQKNIGSNAYVRLYGYTNFSNWINYDPLGYQYVPYTYVGSEDYELTTHTRGASLDFADQITPKHLLQGSASYTYASVTRANNTTPFKAATGGGVRIQLRDPNGYCYSPTTGAPVNCYGAGGLTGGYLIRYGSAIPSLVLPAGAPAGAQYQVVDSGYAVTYNQVAPKFAAFSLSDSWQPTDRIKIDLGLRYNSYIYALADTSQQALVGGPNAAFFPDYNAEHCYNPAQAAFFQVRTVTPNAACPAGYVHTSVSNSYPGSVAAKVLEPRLSGTYTMSPYDVLRFSAGKYSQPTNSAYVQYNRAGDLASYTASNFTIYGFTTPRHDTPPQLSYNYDLSYEKRLVNAPLSFEVTPFFRRTAQQSQTFFLDPVSNFVSGLNVGTQRVYGTELLARYGDFNRDGLSAQVGFTYTNSKIKYQDFAGTNRNNIDLLNGSLIGGYNALTSAGGGSPCYNAAGTGAGLIGGACPAGTLANPYYSAPMQSGFDRNAWYSPYVTLPGSLAGIAAAGNSSSYEVPYVTSLIVQYRKNGWRIVPTLQYDSGPRYGNPFNWVGYDPSSGCTNLDTTQCGVVFRPNPYTGRFERMGEFQQPATLALSAQIAKDLNKRTTLTAILTNVYVKCFQRGYAWDAGGGRGCGYSANAPATVGGAYIGNARNANTNSVLQNDPFGYATAPQVPFNAFFSVQVRM